MDTEFYRQRINFLLDQHLPNDATPLSQAMRYATLNGGKRLRPLLVYASGLSVGAALETLDYPAMAVEIIHAYSLIHDDLPSMDNDLLRRGQPTCHVVFGEALAILTGDAMQAFAFEMLALGKSDRTLAMVRILAQACGAAGMAGGQAEDLRAVGTILSEQQLQIIHQAKTGALIKASILLGALAGAPLDPLWRNDLEQFSVTLGLVYQMQDDIFDIACTTEMRGKQQGADAALNKPTYPAILGLAQSQKQLAHHTANLRQQLLDLKLHTSPLAQLVDAILARTC
jgi:geranylgeranyl pyrophosphate synthase